MQLSIVRSITDDVFVEEVFYYYDRLWSNVVLLNQARTGHRPACAWFLKIDPVWIIGMCVCVCVHARGY